VFESSHGDGFSFVVFVVVVVECCVLSGRGFCDELITRSEESYRVGFVVLCDPRTSAMSPWLVLSSSATGKNVRKVLINCVM